MATYSLSIVTPRGNAFEGSVKSFIVPGVEGNFEILANHAALVALTKSGIATIIQDSGRRYVAMGAGVLEVNAGHNCLALVDFARMAANYDEALERLQKDHSEVYLKSR